MKKHYGEHLDLLFRKGFYSYEWIDGIEKLDYEGIPPTEAFHPQLKHDSVLYDNDDDNENENTGKKTVIK